MQRPAGFFRSLNLGRLNCPTKAQFEEAFYAAGVSSASSNIAGGSWECP